MVTAIQIQRSAQGINAQKKDQSSLCCHHWIIQSQGGPTSRGWCRNCGEVKEFENLPSEPIRGVFLPRRNNFQTGAAI